MSVYIFILFFIRKKRLFSAMQLLLWLSSWCCVNCLFFIKYVLVYKCSCPHKIVTNKQKATSCSTNVVYDAG